jgi:hypothetical protein
MGDLGLDALIGPKRIMSQAVSSEKPCVEGSREELTNQGHRQHRGAAGLGLALFYARQKFGPAQGFHRVVRAHPHQPVQGPASALMAHTNDAFKKIHGIHLAISKQFQCQAIFVAGFVKTSISQGYFDPQQNNLSNHS